MNPNIGLNLLKKHSLDIVLEIKEGLINIEICNSGNRDTIKYDPDGNRVYKEIPGTPDPVKRKYIVDMVGRLPVILLVMDAGNNNSVVNTYVYANSQENKGNGDQKPR